MAFAAPFHTGAFGIGPQIGSQLVATALYHIFQAFVLASYSNPRQEFLAPSAA